MWSSTKRCGTSPGWRSRSWGSSCRWRLGRSTQPSTSYTTGSTRPGQPPWWVGLLYSCLQSSPVYHVVEITLITLMRMPWWHNDIYDFCMKAKAYLLISLSNIPYGQSSAKLPVILSPSNLVIQSLGHSVIQSLGHSVIPSLDHSVIQSLGHLVIQSLGHSVT